MSTGKIVDITGAIKTRLSSSPPTELQAPAKVLKFTLRGGGVGTGPSHIEAIQDSRRDQAALKAIKGDLRGMYLIIHSGAAGLGINSLAAANPINTMFEAILKRDITLARNQMAFAASGLLRDNANGFERVRSICSILDFVFTSALIDAAYHSAHKRRVETAKAYAFEAGGRLDSYGDLGRVKADFLYREFQMNLRGDADILVKSLERFRASNPSGFDTIMSFAASQYVDMGRPAILRNVNPRLAYHASNAFSSLASGDFESARRNISNFLERMPTGHADANAMRLKDKLASALSAALIISAYNNALDMRPYHANLQALEASLRLDGSNAHLAELVRKAFRIAT